MNEIQRLRHSMAEEGIECTPKEITELVEIAKMLKEVSQIPREELEAMFDLQNRRERAIFNAIIEYKDNCLQ